MDNTVKKFKCVSKKPLAMHRFELEWKLHKNIFADVNDENKACKAKSVQTNFFNSSWHFEFAYKSPYYKIDLHQKNAKENEPIVARFTAILKSNDGIDHVKVGVKWGVATNGWGWIDFIGRTQLNEERYWHDECLTIICQVDLRTPTLIATYLTTEINNSSAMQACYLNILKTGIHSDVTFEIEGKEIKAHRGILASRSKYFEAMFSGNFSESNQATIPIADVDAEIFQKMLEYIYSGNLPENALEIAHKLLPLGDKYELDDLVNDCEKLMIPNVILDNFVEYLIIAGFHLRSALKSSVFAFIQDNFAEATGHDTWKKLEQENIQLAYEVVKKLHEM